MKLRILKTALLLFSSLAIISLSYAHGDKEHDSERESFEPVSTEFGSYKPDLEPSHTIEISMADTMRFTPSTLEIRCDQIRCGQ